MTRKSGKPPVTIEKALVRLFGVARVADIPARNDWTPWKRPNVPCAIDEWIENLERKGRRVKLLPRQAFEQQETPFGRTSCPYYDSRLYLLRSVGGAGIIHDKHGDLDQSKAQSARVRLELDRIISHFEDLLKPTFGARWPRNLVLSVVNRETGMIDLNDEAIRVREVYDRLSCLRQAAGEAVREARLLSEFIDKEIKNVTYKGTPLRIWDHAFIEGAAELYRLLTNAIPTQSEVFFSFVKAAYESVGLHTDPSRQIAIVLSKSRARAVEESSSIITAGDGEIFKRKK